MRFINLRRSIYWLVLLLFINVPLWAEDKDACILQGKVTDPSGAVVQGAEVSLEAGGRHRRRRRKIRHGRPDTMILTDKEGRYCFSNVEAGEYRLTVTAQGFEEMQFPSVILGAGDKKVIDIMLSLARKEEVVTVTSTATRTERLLENVPIRVEVVPHEVIKLSASSSLADAVEFTTGIRTENNCQNCNFSQIRLLGLMGNYTQILFDGQPTVSSVAMVYGIEQIPAAMIDRVEVVKGGGSALYGPGSVGGVINIISLKPTKSGAYFEGRYEPTEGLPSFSISAGGDWVSSDKRTALTLYGQADRIKPLDLTGDGYTEVGKRELNAFGFRLNRQLLGQKARLTFDFNRIQEDRRGGDRLDLPEYMANTAESVQSRRNAAGVSWHHTINSKFDYRLTASFAGQYRDSYYGSGMDPNAYGYTDNPLWIVDSQFNHYWLPHVVTWGSQITLDYLQDTQPAYNRIIDKTYTDFGLFVQDDWFFAEGWEFIYGARLDKHSELDDFITSPRAALMWTPKENLKFRGSVATGFQAPQVFDEDLHITQVGGEGRVIRNGKDLKRESSVTYALGMEWRPRWKSGSAMFDFNLFYTGISNLFNVQEDDDPETSDLEFIRVNSGKARVYGVEVNIGYGIAEKFQVEFGYVEQRSRFDRPEPDFSSKDFFRTPDRYGTANLIWRHPRLVDIFIGAKFTGSMKVPHYAGYISEDRLEQSPLFAAFDASVSRSLNFGPGLKATFRIGVKNLTNSYQSDLDQGPDRDAGYVYGPRFPRSFYTTIRFEI
jgi:outer membrane receptor for ferrienterochelin and colicins